MMESDEDVEEFVIDEKHNGICCKICGGKSGTARIITHMRFPFQCKYKNQYALLQSIYKIPINYWKEEWNKYKIKGVIQREYQIIDSVDDVIIGSFGADSCIILCLRNRLNNRVILAHIDANTLYPLFPFLQFNPTDCDAFIVGGNNSTFTHVSSIINAMKHYSFDIIHIFDSQSNSFAIHNKTGDIALNFKQHKIDLFHIEDSRLNKMLGIGSQKTFYC